MLRTRPLQFNKSDAYKIFLSATKFGKADYQPPSREKQNFGMQFSKTYFHNYNRGGQRDYNSNNRRNTRAQYYNRVNNNFRGNRGNRNNRGRGRGSVRGQNNEKGTGASN